MRKLFKKPLIYLIMTMLVLPTWIMTGITNAAHVKAAEIKYLDEGFDGIATPVVAPTGWYFLGIDGIYTTNGNYGKSSPSIKFDDTGDQVTTATFSDATDLSFWMKGMSTDSASSLKIEGYDGAAWRLLKTINPMPTTGTIEKVSLPAAITLVKFSYNKSAGNIALDDVEIFKTTPDTTSPIISDPAIINQTTSNNAYAKIGDEIILSATVTDDNQETITKEMIQADFTALGGGVENPVVFNPVKGIASWAPYAIPSGIGDGTINLPVNANDAAGNPAVEVTASIIIDSTSPEVSLTTTPASPDGNNGWFKTNPEISLNINDASGYISSVKYHWDESLDNEISSPSLPLTINTNVPSEGIHKLSYSAIDGAGNITSGEQEYKVDSISPALLIITSIPTFTKNSNPEITINLENGANFAVLNGSVEIATGTGTGNDQKITLENLTDGLYNLVISATDGAGNINNISIPAFTIDTNSPDPIVENEYTVNNGAVTLSWNASTDPNLAGYNVYRAASPAVQINEDLIPAGTETFTDTPGDGLYTYYITVVDLAGNESEFSNGISFGISMPLNVKVSLGDKELTVSWDKVANADHYLIAYGKANGPVLALLTATDEKAKISNLENGTKYQVTVIAVSKDGLRSKGAIVEGTPAAPVITPAVEEEPVNPPAQSIAPQKVQAQEPQITAGNTNTNNDDNGEIKGEENSEDADSEKINWTPWIVLFVLIILAGAATGGYFYWFSGEEEIKTSSIEDKKTSAKVETTIRAKSNSKKSNKKPKRW